MLKKIIASLVCCYSLLTTSQVNATIVEFQTSQGNFQVNLYDTTIPITVQNFLSYISEQHYTNSVVHRVSPNFIVQGGGYTFSGNWPLTKLTTKSSIANEPVYSNVKGTIAMAKLDANEDSATSQWFFNLKDNSSNLDLQNGGFTVFGQVIGDGMQVIDKISQLGLCANSYLEAIPMVNFPSADCNSLSVPGIENFVVIEQIIIIDSSTVTDADLAPKENTLIDTVQPPVTPSSGGGSIYWLIALLSGMFYSRKIIK